MPTINQICKKRISALGKTFLKSLKRPQQKGVCLKILTRSPKKPNSALRKVSRVRFSNGLVRYCYVPGEGHSLQEFSSVLIRGGRVKDLPGVKHHLIRGCFDLSGLEARKTSRSKYGTKKTNRF